MIDLYRYYELNGDQPAGVDYVLWDEYLTRFDEVLTHTTDTSLTGGYQQYSGDPNPQNVELFPVGDELTGWCVDDTTTYHAVIYDGGGQVREQDDTEAQACGFVPPTCVLTVTAQVTGNSVTITPAQLVGQARYSLDGGLTWQNSATFSNLVPGTYPYKVQDQGVANCVRTGTFTIISSGGDTGGPSTGQLVLITPSGTPAPAVPAGAPLGVQPVGQPIFFPVPATPPTQARFARCELYAESAHYQADYTLVTTQRRVTVGGMAPTFRLDRILLDLLRPDELPAVPTGSVLARQGIRNYFVRWCWELADGSITSWTLGPLRTVLLATVLPAGSVLTAQPAGMSWQPGLAQWVSVLLSATAGTVDVRRTTQAAGGLSLTAAEPVPLPGGGQYRLLHLPLQLGALAAGAQQLRIEVSQGAAVLVPARSYRVSPLPAPPYQLLFLNALGGYDVLPLYQTEVDQDVKHVLGSRVPQPGDTVATRQHTVAVTQETYTLRLLTPWLHRRHLRWLEQLALSRWLWLRAGQQQVPISLPRLQHRYNFDEPQAKGLSIEVQLPDLYRNQLLLPQ